MLILPVNPTTPNEETIIELDDSEWRFITQWNDREQFWYLTVQDIETNNISGLTGVKVVANWQLNRFVKIGDFPQGYLFAMTVDNTDPGYDNLKLVFADLNEAI